MSDTDDNDGVIDPGRAQRHAVRATIAQMQQQLQAAKRSFREPPEEPTIITYLHLQHSLMVILLTLILKYH